MIGGLLVNPEMLAEVRGEVAAEDFENEELRLMFGAMVELEGAGEPIDPVGVQARLPDRWQQPGRVVALMSGVPKLMNVPWYAKIVRRAAESRRALELAWNFSREVEDAEQLETVVSRLIGRLGSFLSGPEQEAATLETVLAGYLDDLQARQEGTLALDWLGTGFEALDKKVGGWASGELIVLAARPSIGKTALAMTSARFRADHEGALYVQQEMPARAMGERLLAAEARVDLQLLRQTNAAQGPSEEQWQRLAQAYARLQALDLVLDCQAYVDVPYLRSRVRAEKARREKSGAGRLRLLVVDYLQLMQGPGSSPNERLARITRELKVLCREEELACLLLSQLKRPESMKGSVPPAPTIHELRDSGAIEADADMVLLLDRPEFYLESAGKDIGDEAAKAYVHVAKNRQGPVGKVTLGFRKDCALFSDVWWP